MDLSNLIDAALIESVVRALIPILLAALGGLLCSRAGIFNIALEGQILVGAFAAVAVSYATGSAGAGVVAGALGSVAFSLLLSFGSVTRKADPIVLGVAMNILAVGVTSFLLVAFFNVQGVFQDPGIKGLPSYEVPVLSDIPWIGRALFSMSWIGYLAIILVPVLWFVIFRTPLGMRLRGVGERPLAAATLSVGASATGTTVTARLALVDACTPPLSVTMTDERAIRRQKPP